MKTHYSIRLMFLLTIIGIFISGFISFGFIVIYKSIGTSFDFIGILVGVLFIWLGSGYLTLMVGKIKTIEFRNGILRIRKPLLNRYFESELSKIKYIDFEWQMTWNTMRGVLIKLEDGKVEQISIKEYRNSNEFIDLITKSCQRDDTIKPNILTRQLKIFMIIGLLIVLGFILLKLIK